MRAAVLYAPNLADGTLLSYPGNDSPREAANLLYSMGIDVMFFAAPDVTGSYSAAQYNAMVSDCNIDLIVHPSCGSNGDDMTRYIFDGDCNVPVFILDTESNFTVRVAGVAARVGGAADVTPATIVSTGSTIYTYGRLYTLSTGTGIVQSQSDNTHYGAWKVSGTNNNVYYCTSRTNGGLLHLLMQEAINDGKLSKPPKRAPIFLNIDHINGTGDSGVYTAGFIGQPTRLDLIASLLRSKGGVCYSNIEQNPTIAAQATAKLTQQLSGYSDVFKYIACHDHSSEDLDNGTYLTASGTANDAIANPEDDAKIVASYDNTKTYIESIGLTVNEDFAHYAGDNLPASWYKLKVQQGWGFKANRIANEEDHANSYPSKTTSDWYVLKQRSRISGVINFVGKDGGTSDNGAEDSDLLNMQAFRNNLQQWTRGQITYHHETDFEDPVLNTVDGLVSDGEAFSRGVMCWQFGAEYQDACPDCVNWGADINDYT